MNTILLVYKKKCNTQYNFIINNNLLIVGITSNNKFYDHADCYKNIFNSFKTLRLPKISLIC